MTVPRCTDYDHVARLFDEVFAPGTLPARARGLAIWLLSHRSRLLTPSQCHALRSFVALSDPTSRPPGDGDGDDTPSHPPRVRRGLLDRL